MSSEIGSCRRPWTDGVLAGSQLFLLATASYLLGWGNSWSGQLEALSNVCLFLSLLYMIGSFVTPGSQAGFSIGEVVLLILVTAYIALSVFLNVPSQDVRGNVFINNPVWWGCFSKMCLAAALLGTRASGGRAGMFLIAAFGFGSFSLAMFFTGYTLIVPGKHVVDAVFNPLDGYQINRAGVMSLVVLFPLFLATLMFYATARNSRTYWAALGLLYAISSGIGFVFESRSVFVLLYSLLPLMVLALLGKKTWTDIKTTFVFLSTLTIFLVSLGILFSNLKRPVSAVLFEDPRFAMGFSFLKQFVSSPLRHAQMTSEMQILAGSHYYHNFFADADRLSGFWSLLAACALLGYVGIRILQLSFACAEGRVLLFMYLPVLLILNTTVVPEGEFQPILLAILLGGIAESIFRQMRADAKRLRINVSRSEVLKAV